MGVVQVFSGGDALARANASPLKGALRIDSFQSGLNLFANSDCK